MNCKESLLTGKGKLKTAELDNLLRGAKVLDVDHKCGFSLFFKLPSNDILCLNLSGGYVSVYGAIMK